jgi:replication-associated recombination protein RarA
VNIYEFAPQQVHLSYAQQGVAAIASLIERRVEIEAVFESREQVLELVKASGGHARQLMTMMQNACLIAHGRKHTKITAEVVDYAIKQEQFNFERSIPDQYYPLLAGVQDLSWKRPNVNRSPRFILETPKLKFGLRYPQKHSSNLRGVT